MRARRGLRVLAAAALAAAASAPAVAELRYEQILEVLPGTWEVDLAETPDYEGSARCDMNPLQISIHESEEGLVYEGVYVGLADTAHRSLIGERPFGIHVKYENEERTTPTGELVEWFLLMPDTNHYYWVRTDWATSSPGARTMMFRRCEGPVA